MIPGEPWLSPRQRENPECKVTDLLTLKPFYTVCWMHIKKERRAGKSDGYPRGEQGILVVYDDDQGPLLARVYFPDTRVYELHDNGYMVYQKFCDQVSGTSEAPEQATPVERSPEYYLPLVGSRHVDPSTGLTNKTVEIKVTPQLDKVAWRRRVIKGEL